MVTSGAGEAMLNALLATAALRGPQQWQRDLVGLLQRRRDVLLDELAAAPEIKVVAPEGRLYFLADVSALGFEAAEFCARLLAEWQVALTPMPGWGPTNSVATPSGSSSAMSQKSASGKQAAASSPSHTRWSTRPRERSAGWAWLRFTKRRSISKPPSSSRERLGGRAVRLTDQQQSGSILVVAIYRTS